MPGFKKFKPNSEKELHAIIQTDLDLIEEGLAVLKYEFVTGKGTPDFLCVDSGRRIVIIEVKLNEDENVLFQALRYYCEIDKNRYTIPSLFPEKKIDPKQHPRIILIAEQFSEDIRRLSALVKPTVELFQYTTLTTPGNQRGIIYHPIQLPMIEDTYTKPVTVSSLIDYLTDESLQQVIEKLRIQIKAIGHDINEYATQGYIGYKFQGRQFAWISVQRKSFDLGAHIIDEKKQLLGGEPIRIEKATDDYSEIFGKIRLAYSNLGGKDITG